jgi:hypothetical protein
MPKFIKNFAEIFSPYDENINLADITAAIISPHEHRIKHTDTPPTSPSHMTTM